MSGKGWELSVISRVTQIIAMTEIHQIHGNNNILLVLNLINRQHLKKDTFHCSVIS